MPPYQLRSGQRLCACSLGEKVIAGSAALRGVAMHQDVGGALRGRCSYASAGCRRMAESRGSKPISEAAGGTEEAGTGRLCGWGCLRPRERERVVPGFHASANGIRCCGKQVGCATHIHSAVRVVWLIPKIGRCMVRA